MTENEPVTERRVVRVSVAVPQYITEQFDADDDAVQACVDLFDELENPAEVLSWRADSGGDGR